MLYLFHPFFQFLRHYIGVGAFQHHGNSAYAFALSVHRHRTETFRCAEADSAYVTDVYGNPVPVGYHDLFNVFDARDHPFRTDVISTPCFLDVASARILVVAAQCFEHFADGDVQRKQGVGVYRHFVLFQITSETVYFHDARYAR